jgi:hypothetical protein
VDAIVGIKTRPDGQHVVLLNPGAEGGGKARADRKRILETVDRHNVSTIDTSAKVLLGLGTEGASFTHLGLDTVDAAAQHREFRFELLKQPLPLICYFRDTIQAGVEQSGGFITRHRLAASETTLGVIGYAAVALDEVAERLISPVGRVKISKLLPP